MKWCEHVAIINTYLYVDVLYKYLYINMHLNTVSNINKESSYPSIPSEVLYILSLATTFLPPLVLPRPTHLIFVPLNKAFNSCNRQIYPASEGVQESQMSPILGTWLHLIKKLKQTITEYRTAQPLGRRISPHKRSPPAGCLPWKSCLFWEHPERGAHVWMKNFTCAYVKGDSLLQPTNLVYSVRNAREVFHMLETHQCWEISSVYVLGGEETSCS